jgi:MYXO-CTERM domain-containing protein
LALSLAALSLSASAQTNTNTSGYTGTTPVQTDRSNDHDYGWLGLIGLAGLAGLLRRRDAPDRSPDVGNRTTR